MKISKLMRTTTAFAMMGIGLLANETQTAQPQQNQTENTITQTDNKNPPVTDKTQVSRLRGKLLYKKGQIRKLEKIVTETNNEIATKNSEFERQRRELFVAAEPKLAQLYEEQDTLEQQIQQMSEALKN
ncbi:MAG: hypothetical protein J6X55_12400 [Victivallales bacterium]|nr:hypothetical protein [Victivallales bacterium]